jgi:sugar lactone lactonase YvrE
MVANFPSSPSINDVYTVDDYSYVWNGSTWGAQPTRINHDLTLERLSTDVSLSFTNNGYNKLINSLFPSINLSFTGIPAGVTSFVFEYDSSERIPNWLITQTATNSASFDIAAQETDISDVVFSSSNAKAYIIGTQNDRVYQFSTTLFLGVVLTFSNDGVSFSVGSQDTAPTGIEFSTDGSKMFILGNTNDRVYQYSLSTAFAVNTASYDNVSFNVSSQDTNPQGIAFNANGTKMFIVGTQTDSVYQYSLSTAWNVSTASYDNVSFSVSSQDIDPTSIAFRADGLRLYVLGNNNDRIYQYRLTTAWDLTTAVYDNISSSISSRDTNATGLAFFSDGTFMCIAGNANNTLYTFNIANSNSTISWGSNIIWDNGVPPVTYLAQNLIVEFYTTDNANTFYGVEKFNRQVT